MSRFDKLADEILEFGWKTSPYSATFSGIHKYDHELDDVTSDFLHETNKKTKDYLSQLTKIGRNELTDDEYIDWRLLRNALESNIKAFEEVRSWQKDPGTYANICLYGLFILFIREFAPIEERAESFLSRIKQVPRLLKDARQNLKDSPEIFTRLAIKVVEGGQAFFKSVVPELCSMVPGISPELNKASAAAADAFDDYASFLKNDYLPKSKGNFAIGRDLFNFKLETDHMLPYKADEIFEIGRQAKQMTEDELKDVSRTIDKKKTWWETVDDIKQHHPDASQLLATYRKEMLAARNFIQTKNLVTIPPAEDLKVIPTPPFDRPTIPYAAYMPPAPFDKEQTGHFYVTEVDENLPEQKKEEVLRGHSLYGIPITALHEGYPGHHLQLVHANRVPRKLRSLLATSVFIEGWALYCEEMMHDEGFYSDPRTKLLKLKDQLWRACRVMIDVSLHNKTMTDEQAIEMLVRDAKLERVHAEKEVVRYTFTPTQPLSYLIGKKQILELRDDYKKKEGAKFNLKGFHDRLLSLGSIPVVLIREVMGLAKSC